jgi:DNA-binding NarL/FixJ family response regulator
MARSRSKTVRLYVIEEQAIYREMYRAALSAGTVKAPIELLGVSANGNVAAARQAISELNPDVLLVGTRNLRDNMIQGLDQIRNDNSRIGIVLLPASSDIEALESLRKIAVKGRGGMAVFLKRSLDRAAQLHEIILAAGHGRVVLDPALATFLFIDKTTYSFLRELTARQLEILRLLAKGYTNAAIAEDLCLDVKTVEHHINNMYGKLKAAVDFDRKHPRVSAARLYLEATGELVPPSMLGEERAGSGSYGGQRRRA